MQAVKRLLTFTVCAIGFGCGASLFASDMKMDPAPTPDNKSVGVQPMSMSKPSCNCDPCDCDPAECTCPNCLAVGCKGRSGRGGGDSSMMMAMLDPAVYSVGNLMPVSTITTVPTVTAAQRYTLAPQTTYETKCMIVNGRQQCYQVPVTSYVQVPVENELAQAPTPQPNFQKPASPALGDTQKVLCPCCGMEMTAEQAEKAKVALASAVAAAVKKRVVAATTTTTPVYTTPVYTSGTTVYGGTMYASDCATCNTMGTVGSYYTGAYYGNGSGVYYGNGDNYYGNGGGRRGLFRRGGRRGGGGGCCGG